jgi:aspartyl-tRNA(Asn)/glutamyl-tRNA(Gln) amidotransferase subunit A
MRRSSTWPSSIRSSRRLADVEAKDLPGLGIDALADLLRRGKTSSEEVIKACLERIDRLNSTLAAFITVDADGALRAARRADRSRARKRSALYGIPFAVKDALWTKGLRTTNGSRLFADFVPAEDATVVARLRAAGAILIGKLNMMELGFGPTLRPPFGTPRNPWNVERTPGGSSSGSASAVAARLVPVTLGADTGGSIRLPAALCGVVGLKPTRGRVSRYGLMGICPPFDSAGPIAASARDAAHVLRIIAGHDHRDPGTSRAAVADYVAATRRGVHGARIGVVKEFMESAVLEDDTHRLVTEAVAALGKIRARVSHVSIPLLAHASAMYVGIAEPEAAAVFRQCLTTRAGEIDVLPRRRLLAASLVPASVIATARRLGERLREQVDEALRDVDVLVGPTTPSAAPPIPTAPRLRSKEEAWMTAVAGRSVFTNPFNITGHPALSLPCGFTGDALPVGLQIVGRCHEEAYLLRIGAAYESVTEWHRRRPSLA